MGMMGFVGIIPWSPAREGWDLGLHFCLNSELRILQGLLGSQQNGNDRDLLGLSRVWEGLSHLHERDGFGFLALSA